MPRINGTDSFVPAGWNPVNMALALSIIGLITIFGPVIVILIRRYLARKDAPETQRNEIDAALSKADGDKVNEILDDEIRANHPTIPPTTDKHRD